MNKVLGIGLTGLSVMVAALVSGFRLRPYLDAGETYTPPTFALYPALIAVAVAVPVGLLLRWWHGKEVDIGPVTFTDRQPFIVLWCLFYVAVAVTFFPYRPPPKPVFPSPPASPEEPATPGKQQIDTPLPLFEKNLPVYL
jgi:hypothetical protein